jgi:SAM-dependent methyltransferase
VADIGCGMGDTAVQLAEYIGEDGEVVGIDCAHNFIQASEQRAHELGVPNARFVAADVEFDDLGGPYDDAYSRFGTMFFNNPVAALRNIRTSLKPGGRLVMSVWRKRQDNPCFYTAQHVVERYIDESDKRTDSVTCGPGPFSMAGPDMVSDQLHAAGFTLPQFTRFDAPMCIGRDVDEALQFARDLGPAGESLRLADEKAAHLKDEIEAALREALQPYVQDDGVWATSSTWLVVARAPET